MWPGVRSNGTVDSTICWSIKIAANGGKTTVLWTPRRHTRIVYTERGCLNTFAHVVAVCLCVLWKRIYSCDFPVCKIGFFWTQPVLCGAVVFLCWLATINRLLSGYLSNASCSRQRSNRKRGAGNRAYTHVMWVAYSESAIQLFSISFVFDKISYKCLLVRHLKQSFHSYEWSEIP